MAQSINLKHRIKAAETIKKITHAMRLISMSNNLKLRSKKIFLDNYNQEIKKLWSLVSLNIFAEKNIVQSKKNKNLIIILTSEKGLCGNFNNALITYFNNHKHEDKINNNFITDQDIIIIGKEGIKQLKQENIETILNYPVFNSSNFNNISKELSKYIQDNLENYQQVIVYNNWPKSFFVQKQKKTIIYPIQNIIINNNNNNNNNFSNQDYIWPQSRESLKKSLQNSLIYISLSELLYESLLAEQAARFISMDSATRNASDLINTMKLEYNKLRQAAITRELTELSGT